MFDKKTSVTFEDYKVDVEVDSEHGFITLCLIQLIKGEDEDLYQEGQKVEIYPGSDELEQVVRVLQETIDISRQAK